MPFFAQFSQYTYFCGVLLENQNKMKRTILFSLLCLAAMLYAEDSIPQPSTLPIADAMAGKVTLVQDSNLTRLMLDKVEGIEREQVQIQGFRVQVFSNSAPQTAKTEAFKVEKTVEELGLDIPVHVLYNPPFWKVRVGDYRTHEEALMMKDELIRLLPDMQGDIYVVKDQIEVIQQR